MIDQFTIERILDAANIVNVVSEFVTLRKRGVNYVGLCPFHNEKTPSFYVSPAKGICKCFSCGKGGNVIHFLMEHEQMSFYDAAEWLADKYGIPFQRRELTDTERALQNERESLFVVNQFAKDYFTQTLHTPKGKAVGMAYFHKRGFRDDIIEKFQLGYSTNDPDALAGLALKKGYTKENLVKAGVCLEREDGTLLDRFRGRVIFPIHSLSGKIVAFGGRIMNSKADVVGSDSLLYEIELIQMIDTVFDRLGVRVAIKLNNRKILVGIAELIGHADKIVEITVAIDKLDKIGLAGVNAELLSKGLPQDAIDKIQPIINLTGSNSDKLDTIAGILAESKTGLKGVEECRYILNGIERLGVKNTLELDLTLARGLNYYTGAILEVKALDMEIGSICGGGRYDNLTGIFGLPGVSGVGISFGADRIYDVLNRLDLYPRETQGGVKVLFLNLGEKEAQFCMGLLAGLRRAGIASEIYPDAVKMRKQMSYANANAVRYVVIVGSDELAQGKVTLKNMETGEQSLVDADRLVKLIV
jgi:histidyl-tRNA synthetase